MPVGPREGVRESGHFHTRTRERQKQGVIDHPESTRSTEPVSETRDDASESHGERARGTQTVSRRTLLALSTGAIGALAGCSVPLLGPSTPECSGQQTTGLSAPTAGPSSAPVSVDIYTDFACPHCRDFFLDVYPTVRQRIPTETATYVHHDFPVPVSEWSYPVASAARAVQHTNSDRAFWTFAELAYQNQGEYSNDVLERLAQDVKTDPQTVRRAAEQLPYCRLLKRERKRGTDRGVEGTPTLFVNDQKLEAPSVDELTSAITNTAPNATPNRYPPHNYISDYSLDK